MHPITALRRARRSAVPALIAALIVTLACCAAGRAVAQNAADPVTATLRGRIGVLSAGGAVFIDGERLYATRSLVPIYAGNGYRPLWDGARLQALSEVIKDIEDDGLRPQDYHAAALHRLMRRPALPPREAAGLDLLATDAYALLLYHLYFGKVDPVSSDPDWNFGRRAIGDVDAAAFVRDAIARDRIRSSIEAVRPAHWMYRAGRESLAAYRRLAAQGGWPRIPRGPAIKVGDADPRVPLLRERLAITGDLAAVDGVTRSAPGVPADLYDPTLEAALKHAQHRHRLEPDGVLGPKTLRELNIPVQQRIGQLRVNLERGRQVLHEVKDGPLVVVDIAGFEVHYLVDRRRVWQARAVVGQPFRRTPVFKAMIEDIVINPTWTVPPGILAEDILPSLRRNDRSVLTRKRLSVLDRNGHAVDPATIDFRGRTLRGFPYTLRQEAGPDNALGVVKIDFPNPHLVYLHDTPSKALFDADMRTFSSGCIRVERPLELAALLLADPVHWDRAALDAAVAAGGTRIVRLPRKVPVLIMYWTADRDEDGSVVFKPDPYSRDAQELAALDRPFRPGRRPKP